MLTRCYNIVWQCFSDCILGPFCGRDGDWERPAWSWQDRHRFSSPGSSPLEAFVTLDSAGIYDLDTTCVPDVLGIACPAPWVNVYILVKVMQGRDSQSVRENKRPWFSCHTPRHGGCGCERFHEWSILRLQWPVSVVSGLARQQLELGQRRHACKKRYLGGPDGMLFLLREGDKIGYGPACG